MTPTEKLAMLERLIADHEAYCEHCLKVLPKQGGQVVPLRMNRAQKYVHKRLEEQLRKTGKVRALILKGRQQGISTYVAARFYRIASTLFGQNVSIIAHELKATGTLYDIVRRYQEHNPLAPETGATNAQELVFSKLDGTYKLATAGTKDVGRSTMARLLHACLAPDSLIVDGATGRLRRMDSFSVGDVVRTHTGKRAFVSFISSKKAAAKTVVLRSVVAFPLVATGEHRFWTPEGWKELKDIKEGDEVGFPVTKIESQKIFEAFRLPNRDRPQGGGSIERCPATVELNYALGRIMGLYLAEGSIQRQSKDKTPSAVQFSVHEREAERTVQWLNEVSALFTSTNTYHHKNGSKTVVVTAYGKSFAAFMERKCGASDSKRVPEEWVFAGDEFARGIAHGYLSGDGGFSAKRDRKISATSIRSAITIGIRDILASLGYGWASIAFKPAAVRAGRNERDAYILTLAGPGVVALSMECGKPFLPYRRRAGGGNYGSEIRDGYAWLRVQSIGESFDQEVMDFEVDHDDHSYCTVHCATHNSEFAFWQNPSMHLAGIGNTVPDMDGTEIILESTANGIGNLFHQLWQRAEAGEGEYIPIFVPWFWQEEYRAAVPKNFELDDDEQKYAETYKLDMGQMAWRRNKIATYEKGFEWLFDQEFPATPALAFVAPNVNPLISPLLVSAAVHNTFRDAYGPLVIGCDPSEGIGRDRTAIVFRKGRVVTRVEAHDYLTPMACAGLLANYNKEFKPAMIFVDRGAGAGIIDRLGELGVPCIGVGFGEQANNPNVYVNKRAEMWWAVKEWLEDMPCRIPNDPELIADLSAVGFPKGYMLNSSGKRQLESKEALDKRGIRSTDLGDAMALTLSEAVADNVTVESHEMYVRETAGAPTRAGY